MDAARLVELGSLRVVAQLGLAAVVVKFKYFVYGDSAVITFHGKTLDDALGVFFDLLYCKHIDKMLLSE